MRATDNDTNNKHYTVQFSVIRHSVVGFHDTSEFEIASVFAIMYPIYNPNGTHFTKAEAKVKQGR